jgi:Uncharacterized protein conserved in bacteria
VTGIDGLSRELETQAAFLKDREPVYERMLALFADATSGEFGARLARLWADRTFNSPYERPLLLLAAVRYDVLCEGTGHPLHDALAGSPVCADAVTPDAFLASLSPTRTRVDEALRGRAVQTNETTRGVVWLWPAHLLSLAGERRSIALVDLGTSAGLNLVADDLPARWVDDREVQLPLEPRPPIALRLGLDIAPLDVRGIDDAMWLRACIWPSDRPRLSRLEQAIEAFIARAARGDAPTLESCSLPRAPGRLSSLPDNLFVLCIQTIVRDYLTAAERETYEAGMQAFLLKRPPHSALVVELEVDLGSLDVPAQSAMLVFRFASAEGKLHTTLMARTHPHPRQLFINPGAVEAFTDAFTPAGRESRTST